MKKRDLKEKASQFPKTPGVYFMKDAKERVIYIGKAKNLKNRVTSYFRKNFTSEEVKTKQMMDQVRDIDYLELPSEIDALLAEARLIKDTQPRYNLMLKDDKSFPWIKLTNDDDFPKLLVTRERNDQTAEWFGPFVDAEGLRNGVKALQKVFKFATCQLYIQDDDPRKRFVRPCLLYSIDRCTGPCAGRISKEEYAVDIDSLRQYLNGKRKKLIKTLYRKMESASEELDFERATEMRDQIRGLDRLSKSSASDQYIEGDLTPIDPKLGVQDLTKMLKRAGAKCGTVRSVDGADIANISGEDSVGSIVTFIDGIPHKATYKRYRIKEVEGVDDYAMMREVIGRRFRRLKNDPELSFPHVQLIDGGIGHLNAALDIVRELNITETVFLSLAKKEERVYFAGKKGIQEITNAHEFSHGWELLKYIRDESHRFAQHYHHILRKKRLYS